MITEQVDSVYPEACKEGLLANLAQSQVLAVELESDVGYSKLHLMLSYNDPLEIKIRPSSETGQREMFVGPLRINPTLRKEGLATRLLSAALWIAKQETVVIMHSNVTSQYSVMSLRNLVGDDNIVYYDVDPKKHKVICLPMTTTEAISSLERAEKKEKNLEEREIGFDFKINLANISIRNFEEPLLV